MGNPPSSHGEREGEAGAPAKRVVTWLLEGATQALVIDATDHQIDRLVYGLMEEVLKSLLKIPFQSSV
jgi:hypothetical protein